MTDIDITALRALAEAAIANSQPHEEDWYESDYLVRVVAETDASFIAAASPGVVLRLIDRSRSLEHTAAAAVQTAATAVRALKETKERVALVESERDALAARRCECAVDETCAMQREIDSLRAERVYTGTERTR